MNEICLFVRLCWIYLPNSGHFAQPQYSQKEDKYEEEIKVLTDKLKEVSYAWMIIVELFKVQ